MDRPDQLQVIEKQWFGFGPYTLPTPAISGVIKTYPEDFQVVEIDEYGKKVDGKGRYNETGSFLHFLAYRIDMNHDDMIHRLADFFQVSTDDIGTGGIKDKKAVVIQEVSVFNPNQNRNFQEATINPSLKIKRLGFNRRGMVKGHIGGNHFNIVIRQVNPSSTSKLNEMLQKLSESGVPNYYGHQRFGADRPITWMFGKALLMEEYEKAVDIYLGLEPLYSRDGFRTVWRDTHDPKLVLQHGDYIPQYEYKILRSLLQNPSDYRGALTNLSPFLITFAKRSFVSFLWNRYLTLRLNSDPKQPLQGERKVVEADGKINLEVALPSKKWPKPLNDIWDEIFAEEQVDVSLFKSMSHSARKVILWPRGLKGRIIDNTTISLQFQLMAGQYATVVLREIMKTAPESFC